MLAGIPVHAVQRGNNHGACFFREEDRAFYLHHMGRLLRPSGCVLHAYCLMTNHVHLLLTPLHTRSCGLLMKHLGQLHSQYVNRTYGRTGSLWEGRFRSCLVQSEEYLLACHRYIELNPVRAGLVDHPGQYRWSSYRANAEDEISDVVIQHEEYLRLGGNAGERRRAYRALFDSRPGSNRFDEIREATNGNFALGGDAFRRKMAATLGRRVERANAGRPVRRSEDSGVQLDLLGQPGKSWSVPD
jgi:putative transposase